MVTQMQQRFYTLEEYRQLEETAEIRSEYRDGEIVPMTGGTINHDRPPGAWKPRLFRAWRKRDTANLFAFNIKSIVISIFSVNLCTKLVANSLN